MFGLFENPKCPLHKVNCYFSFNLASYTCHECDLVKYRCETWQFGGMQYLHYENSWMAFYKNGKASHGFMVDDNNFLRKARCLYGKDEIYSLFLKGKLDDVIRSFSQKIYR